MSPTQDNQVGFTSSTKKGDEETGQGDDDKARQERLEKMATKEQSVYGDISYIPGVKVRLFSPPRQRQKWGSKQEIPHVNWGDLFFDLFYVAAFYNLGNIFVQGDPDPVSVLYFLTCFFSIMQLWNDKTFYDAKFVYGDDIWHKIFDSLFLLVVATACCSIGPVRKMSDPNDKGGDMFGFALAIVLGTLMNWIRYIETYFYGNGQKKNIQHTARMNIGWSAVPFCFYLAAFILTVIEPRRRITEYNANGGHRRLADEASDGAAACESDPYHIPIILLMAGYAAQQLIVLTRVIFFHPAEGKHKEFTIPLNVDFCIHRYGELTMLILGEAILSLIIVDEGDGLGKYVSTLYGGLLATILLQLLHYRSLPHKVSEHALQRGKNAGVIWYQMYVFYSAALLSVGVCFKLFLYQIQKGDPDKKSDEGYEGHGRLLAGGKADPCGLAFEYRKYNTAVLFSVSLAIVFATLDFMLWAHFGKKKLLGSTKTEDGKPNLKKWFFVLLPREAITVFTLTLYFWQTDPDTLTWIGVGVVFGEWLTRILGNIFSKCDDEESDKLGHLDDTEDGDGSTEGHA